MSLGDVEGFMIREAAAMGLPPRTYFSAPAPIGVGTSDLEALGSYVARIAARHRVTFADLIDRCLVWLALDEPHRCGEHREWRPHGARRFCDLDSTGASARVLSAATGFPLAPLTFGSFAGTFAIRGLLAHQRRWCPDCLRESCHERLSWQLARMQACPRHGRRLESQCPSCSWSGAPYAGTYIVGRCPKCAAPLSTGGGNRASQGHLRVARSIADFLARIDTIRSHLGPTLVTTRFQTACESAGLPSMLAACREFGIPKGSASGWWRGTSTPTLEKACAMASMFGLELGEFLQGAAGAARDARLRKEHRQPRTTEWSGIESAVSAHRDATESVRELATRLGVDRAELRRRMPNHCRDISARARRERARAATEGRQRRAARLCAAVDAAGGRTGVREGMPGNFRDPAVRRIVKLHLRQRGGHS